MTKDEFHSTLSMAISGNSEALANIIEQYMPLINRYSHVDGKLDEDLRQDILVEIFRSIGRFKI